LVHGDTEKREKTPACSEGAPAPLLSWFVLRQAPREI
jgi:hypothetical protein